MGEIDSIWMVRRKLSTPHYLVGEMWIISLTNTFHTLKRFALTNFSNSFNSFPSNRMIKITIDMEFIYEFINFVNISCMSFIIEICLIIQHPVICIYWVNFKHCQMPLFCIRGNVLNRKWTACMYMYTYIFVCVCVCARLQCARRNSCFNERFLSVIIVGSAGSGD